MFIDGISYTFKMYEYREKSTTGENEEQSAQAHRANAIDHRVEESYLNLAKDYGLIGEMDIGESDSDTQTVEQEYQAYVTGKLSKHEEGILKFWEVGWCCVMILWSMLTVLQNNCTTFPTLFAIAMDYILVQASSVPCERVFSSSAETDMKRRNCINPMLMEALQMLKFHLKKKRLDFMVGWMTKEKQMVEDSLERDFLQKVLQESLKDQLDILDAIIQADKDWQLYLCAHVSLVSIRLRHHSI